MELVETPEIPKTWFEKLDALFIGQGEPVVNKKSVYSALFDNAKIFDETGKKFSIRTDKATNKRYVWRIK